MKRNNNTKNIFSSNWLITLTATLVGVFLALYLNQKVESQNLAKKKDVAITNILKEIKKNKTELEKSIVDHVEFHDFTKFQATYFNEDNQMIAPLDSLNKFRNKHPKLISITDSTLLNNGNYHYHGESNFNLSIQHYQLSTIAWKTLLNSNISTTFNFDCLMHLELIDKLINDLMLKDEELWEYFFGKKDSGEENEYLLEHLDQMIHYENSLVRVFSESEEILNNCD